MTPKQSVEIIYNHTSAEINSELIEKLKQQFPTAQIYCTPDYVLDPEAADPDVTVWEVRLFVPTDVPNILIPFIEIKRQHLLDEFPIDWISTEVTDPTTVREYAKNYSYWKQ
jgi:hypothetical protein